MFTERHTRRGFLGLTGLTAMSVVLAACGGGGAAAVTEETVETPEEALLRLIEGNIRYHTDKSTTVNEGVERREKLTKRQRPFATVFSCVDSRVPPELVFDRGLGDLFVVRTAGQVLDQAVLGSIEYGVAELEIPLLVVMGHSACGAVKATVGSIASGEVPEAEIAYLVDSIAPAVAMAKEKMKPVAKTTKKKAAATTTTVAEGEVEVTAEAEVAATAEVAAEGAAAEEEGDDKGATTTVAEEADPDHDLIVHAIHANVELVVERLKEIPLLAEKIKKDRLLIVGGVYDLATGDTDISIGVPDDLMAEIKKLKEAAAPASEEAPAEGEEGATTTEGGH
jgi:carbonic anhydrase